MSPVSNKWSVRTWLSVWQIGVGWRCLHAPDIVLRLLDLPSRAARFPCRHARPGDALGAAEVFLPIPHHRAVFVAVDFHTFGGATGRSQRRKQDAADHQCANFHGLPLFTESGSCRSSIQATRV